MRFNKLLFFAIGLVFHCNIHGQIKYEVLSSSKGLSQGYVNDILQSSDGFMWFATKDGLNRFDGYRFKVYTYDSYDPYSISNNSITKIFEDSQKRLWICTENGLNIYDKNKDRFIRIVNDPNDPNSLSGNKVAVNLLELPDGRFLVGPSEHFVNIFTIPEGFPENGKKLIFQRLTNKAAFNVQYIFKDGTNQIWFIADRSLYQFHPENSGFTWIRDGVDIMQTFLDNDGQLWTNDLYYNLFDNGSLIPLFDKPFYPGHGTTFFRDGNTLWVGITNVEKFQIYDVSAWKKGKPLNAANAIRSEFDRITPLKIFKDKSGQIWVGTNGYGIRKYAFDAEKFHHLQEGMSAREIVTTYDNEIIVRGWGGLKKIDLYGNMLTSNEFASLHNHESLLVARDNTFWLIQRRQVNDFKFAAEAIENYNPRTKKWLKYPLPFDENFDLQGPTIEDSRGNLWIGGTGGSLMVFNPNSGTNKKLNINTDANNVMLSDAIIAHIYEDGLGIFWFATSTGLAKMIYNAESNAPPGIVWYSNNANNKKSLNYNNVTCILEDPFDQNVLWVATKGGGLNRMNKSTGEFEHITNREGLCNNVVYGILSDENGQIWGSTNYGIFVIDPKKKGSNWDIKHFTSASGLQADEFNTGAFSKLKNGYLAFGGVNGLNVFNPAEILRDTFSPNIYITKLSIENQEVTPHDETGILESSIQTAKNLRFKHDQDNFTLEYAALDFRASDQIRYRHQLVGVDHQWIESGNRRTVSYSHLTPGTYTFKVQGSNRLGIWSNNIAQLSITILPPWWNTWWAWLAYILMAGLLVKLYLNYVLKQNQMATQLAFEQKEARRIKELDMVKTQLYTNITHEFRTPLTVILGMAQQIKTGTTEHLQNGVDMIIRNGNNLLKLVNELLDLSKIEAGKMDVQLIEGDVIQFLRYIVESFSSMAESQGKSLHYLSSVDTLYAKYDGEKLRQIAYNLLSNSIKFTPAKGNIYISISAEEGQKANYKHLIVKVKDTGVGIPEHLIPNIFDRFYQVDPGLSRKAEGTGIGLALSKELVNLMHGEISVKSPPTGAKVGTEFIFSLPLELANSFETGIAQSVVPGVSNAPLNTIEYKNIQTKSTPGEISETGLILLVEDNIDVVAYTASCLPDYRLVVGKDGKEGFEIACKTIPDIIITDVMMPYIDGFEMTRLLKQEVKTSHIPIIILTAKADLESKLEGLDYGAEAYLEKPFNKEELRIRIKKLLEQRKNLQKIYSGYLTSDLLLPVAQTPQIQSGKEPEIASPIENEFVHKVRLEIEKNLSDELFSVEHLAKNLFMSYSQLHRKLTAVLGVSPNQMIKNLRIIKAQELLSSTNQSITQISAACGFNDVSYFGKVFRQECGMTPQDWRMRK